MRTWMLVALGLTSACGEELAGDLPATASKPAHSATPTTTPAKPTPAPVAPMPVAPMPSVPPAPSPTKVSVMRLADVPKGVEVRGKLEKAVGWTDANGENRAVFSTREWKGKRTRDDATFSKALQVDHVSQGKLLRSIKDQVADCAFDLLVDFIDAALGITDLDRDGFGELTFAYRTQCASDVSPATLKLVMLENGDKYIIRGDTRVDTGAGQKVGGLGTPDDAMKASPFYSHADKVWKQIVETR